MTIDLSKTYDWTIGNLWDFSYDTTLSISQIEKAYDIYRKCIADSVFTLYTQHILFLEKFCISTKLNLKISAINTNVNFLIKMQRFIRRILFSTIISNYSYPSFFQCQIGLLKAPSENYLLKELFVNCALLLDIMADNISRYLEYKPSILGACCGSTPEHIRKIAAVI